VLPGSQNQTALEGDRARVRRIVDEGTQRARAVAQETMRDVREAMGLAY
jgi:tryptophanyl-tRNA synthetase